MTLWPVRWKRRSISAAVVKTRLVWIVQHDRVCSMHMHLRRASGDYWWVPQPWPFPWVRP